MPTEDIFLSTLRQKEAELVKQLESLRTTISMFYKDQVDAISLFTPRPVRNDNNSVKIPVAYDENDTWSNKILFALNNIKKGLVSDIVKELKKHTSEHDDKFLTKRVGVVAYTLRKEGVLNGIQKGNKMEYSIK